MTLSSSTLSESAPESTDGMRFGPATTSLIGFYGKTPVALRATSGLHQASLLSIASNTTIAASLTAWILEVTATLVGLGIWV